MLRRLKLFIGERKHSADDLAWLAAKWLELRASRVDPSSMAWEKTSGDRSSAFSIKRVDKRARRWDQEA